MAGKVFVKATAEFETDGRITPMSIIWEDGRKFEIDAILDVRRAASLRVGGAGIRYTCRIREKVIYLFLEEMQWFIEGKD